MIFEDRFDLGAEWRLLHRVAEQVTDHSEVVRIGKFNHRNDEWSGLLERRMHRIPRSHPGIEAPAAGHPMPSEIAALAFVANPFRTELQGLAACASLHH